MSVVRGRSIATTPYDDAADALAESEIVRQFAKSMSIAKQKRIQRNAPIAKYDPILRKVYMEYPDGKKVYNEA